MSVNNPLAGTAAMALLFSVAMGAQDRQLPPTGELAPGGTSLVAGQVIDPGTGRPVPDAIVALWIYGATGAGARVMADAQGRFVFVNAPAGKYRLRAEKPGYSTGYFNQRTVDGPESFVEVSDNQILTDLAVAAWKCGAISGTVTDEAGQAVVGVSVEAYRKTVLYGEVRLAPRDILRTSDVTTDDRGMYRLSNLPPGEYAVAMPSALTTFPAGIMAQTQTVGPIRSQAYFALGDTAGPLGDARNQQVGDAVLLIDSRTAFPPGALESSVALVYRTTFAPGTPLPAEAATVTLRGDDERTLDIALKPSRAVRVAGTLVGPDGSMAHTPVSLIATGTFQTGISVYPRDGATVSALTDGQGRFTFLGVPEGEYIVAMRAGEPSSGFVSASQPISVGGEDISTVTVTARRATRVTGHFELRGKVPQSQVNGIGGASVYAVYEPLEAGLANFVLARLGADFRFEGSAPAGRYALTLRGPDGVSCTAMVGGHDVSDELFVVGNDPMEMTIVCGDAPTRVRGTVRKDDGAADPDAAVVAFPVERAFWRGPTLRPHRLMQVTSDKSGAYSLVNLPAGDYFVVAIPLDKSALWQDPRFLERLARSATRVTLGPGDSRTADLRTVEIK